LPFSKETYIKHRGVCEIQEGEHVKGNYRRNEICWALKVSKNFIRQRKRKYSRQGESMRKAKRHESTCYAWRTAKQTNRLPRLSRRNG
jgi:hypothetical protein